MIEYKTIYDISVLLGEESIDYPGDTPYSSELLSSIKDGGVYELSKIHMSAHSGTHIDSPAHFIANGKTIDQYDAGDFVLSAVVVDIDNGTAVTLDDLSDIMFQPGEALLFRTENSTSGRCRNGVFSKDFVYLTKEAAKVCVERGIALVGIDYISIEQYGSKSFDAHLTLLKAGVLVLEGINLSHVQAGRYTLFCLPLKMKGVEASPVRAMLME